MIPGTVIGVSTRVFRILPVYHVGILTEFSPRQVLLVHASRLRGAVVESDVAEFIRTASGPPHVAGYPSRLPPSEVIERARSRLGLPYDWRRANCEHLVAFAHGLEEASPQWDNWYTRAIAISRDPYDLERRDIPDPIEAAQKTWRS